MRVYIFGAGASVDAGYPLASQLLPSLSAWLDRLSSSVAWVPRARNRLLQLRETFGSLYDCEALLGKLERCGHRRVRPTGPTTYTQDQDDLFHDLTGGAQLGGCGNSSSPARGFYPQYSRAALVSALREYFYDIEERRSTPTAYDRFAERVTRDSAIITFNYDLALERALRGAGLWDIGDGYGHVAFPGRPHSATTIFKLHGSVTWFKEPTNSTPPPVIFTRDLSLLGYPDLSDARIGRGGICVDNEGTFILPSPKKKFPWDAFWLPLWNAAGARLQRADEVYIHGYSMPQSDSQARALLFRNIRKSATVNVYCLDHSDCLAQEFRKRGFTSSFPHPGIRFDNWVAA